MAAYDYLLAGKIHHHRFTKDDNAKALEVLDKAIKHDPGFAAAYAWKACVLGQAIARGYMEKPDELFAVAVQAVEKAFSLDENDVEAHRILCEVNMIRRQWDQAQLHNKKALALNPNDPRMVAQRGELFTWLGKPDEGAEWVEKAMRLDPYDAHSRAHLLGRALHASQRYAEAADTYKQIRSPRFGHCADLAACYAQMGMDAEAKTQAEEVLKRKPDFSVAGYVDSLSYRDDADREHHREGLHKAGLPE
jgi:adenylate cyclase